MFKILIVTLLSLSSLNGLPFAQDSKVKVIWLEIKIQNNKKYFFKLFQFKSALIMELVFQMEMGISFVDVHQIQLEVNVK